MPLLRLRSLFPLLALLCLLALFAVACSDDDDDDDGGDRTPATATTADADETPTTGGDEGSTTLEIATTGEEIAYDKDELTAPADTEITVQYTNDSTIPHNINFFNGDDASAESLGATDLVAGPDATEKVTFTTPADSGEYFFHCDVHPDQMTGFLVVE